MEHTNYLTLYPSSDSFGEVCTGLHLNAIYRGNSSIAPTTKKAKV